MQKRNSAHPSNAMGMPAQQDNAILCFGDSNTWGYIPLSGERLSRAERWPGVLQKSLGNSFLVIEEGLNGRTTAFNEPFRDGRNARTTLPSLLESHAPIALLIIMLGTNDLKHHFNVSAHESSRGINSLLQVINNSTAGFENKPPRTLVIAPPKFGEMSEAMSHHFQDAREKSAELPRHYSQSCAQFGCSFFDANQVVTVSVDGIHLDVEGHRELASALAPQVLRLVNAIG
ncbi:MAG: SGNH/GDSL hydrolase family protein [Cyanobacteriota bacterium]|nr:SGNH/GDSL hydrolase family protein [Cyanobacteriota bacterium]